MESEAPRGDSGQVAMGKRSPQNVDALRQAGSALIGSFGLLWCSEYVSSMQEDSLGHHIELQPLGDARNCD